MAAGPEPPLREQASRILRAAIEAADARAAVRRALKIEGNNLRIDDTAIDLGSVRRIHLIGAGKAACAMALGARDVLGDRLDGGTITTKHGHARSVPAIDVWEAGHPLPDANGMAGAVEALHTARAAGPDDVLLCLLSGGASALWPAPPPGIALGDLQRVTDALLRAGAPIGELNAVRKHLSRISGGQLARAAAPARVLTLAVSDVVDSPPDVVGGGPPRAPPTTGAG